MIAGNGASIAEGNLTMSDPLGGDAKNTRLMGSRKLIPVTCVGPIEGDHGASRHLEKPHDVQVGEIVGGVTFMRTIMVGKWTAVE
jgi:hypothetical protein